MLNCHHLTRKRRPAGIDDATAYEAMTLLIGVAAGARHEAGKRIFLECLAKALVAGPSEKDGRPPTEQDAKKAPGADLKALGEQLKKLAGLDKDKR